MSVSMTDDESAVRDVNEAFYAAFRTRDYAAMQQVWVQRGAALCVHPGWDVLRGRDVVLESWRRILSNPGAPKIACSNVRVTVLGDAAVVTCREGIAGQPAGIVATNVFVRRATGWRMMHHHAGPMAPSEQPPPEELLN